MSAKAVRFQGKWEASDRLRHKTPISNFIQICSAALRVLQFGQTVAKMRGADWQRFIPDALGMGMIVLVHLVASEDRVWLLVHDAI